MDDQKGIGTGLLIDWITLRHRVDTLPPTLQERLFAHVDQVICCSADMSELRWEQKRFRWDDIRSDSSGVFLTVRWVGPTAFLYLGASPASLAFKCNVFGNLDVIDAAETLLAHARVCLQSFLPMDLAEWDCCRLDVTGNYALPDAASVKTALRQLLGTDAARRKATSAKNGGDTVLWSPASDLIAGKAYHKGPHLAHLVGKGKLDLPADLVQLADRLLRLELRIGSRWLRRLAESKLNRALRGVRWFELSADHLAEVFQGFFGPLCGGVEVHGMERVDWLNRIVAATGCTFGAARAVLGTWRAIRELGYHEAKAEMSERTFRRHVKALKDAGVSEGSLIAGNVVQFRPVRIVLAQPVQSWEQLRRAA